MNRKPPLENARVRILGGTSDALALCRVMSRRGVSYSLSVATATGEALAAGVGGARQVGRMDADEMAGWLLGARWVIDASHPYAELASRNLAAACRALRLPLTRYERPSDIDSIAHRRLLPVASLEQACRKAAGLGQRILLTTGSKQLADYVRLLPGKTLIARVLPTAAILDQCAQLGLGVNQVIAMTGPFSRELNLALYRHYRPDVMITKESGREGGYAEKVLPCLELNIPCVVIRRPVMYWDDVISTPEDFDRRLDLWLRAADAAMKE
ncbi:precorrin-6A reductase [Acerihabitans arboris]|uniref:Precorrin-6A reductase n=1 Tax=Acerihabitans arboris TaxID=2691583 RepID=A0A845SH37_9GAMM|nr:precorrin-6A reductase [Acerihabitans arboris]NDL63179.1 precorrin-6A reductase [Acerihabitans arboris]